MPQSLANVLVHVVFSTKGRRPLLARDDLRQETHCYIGGISNQLDCASIIVGGTNDHVHLLARQARTISLADWIKELKRGSSIWIKTRDRTLESFQWQAGYGAFSVSQSQCAAVQRYVEGQQEHHRRLSFQDEFRQLLQKHGVEFDERYVWD
jgi:REP element-mobilizing transposase RayT